MSAPILAIANRAEIAVRIAATAWELGWTPVALLGEPDWDGYAAREIGRLIRLEGGAELDPQAVVRAALDAGATALHPGYGFLSERPALSRACASAGITFVGPSPETLELAGDKVRTREIAERQGIPVVPASPKLDVDDRESWLRAAAEIGYPVMAKVAGAGGGRGLRVARDEGELTGAVQSALNEAGGSGAAEEIFLERYLEGARHVEVQVAGDGQAAMVLGDRDCSLQRRHQKVIEEAPAPGLDDDLREAIHAAAAKMAEGIGLLNLATIEFLLDRDGRFYFMEINPRLQVEHTVTEEVTGLDLVALQLFLALGSPLPEPVAARGHAIQARLYAEDPFQQFLPSPGRILALDFTGELDIAPARLRVDRGYEAGDTVPGAYDPLIAKIIVSERDRETAISGLVEALERARVAGVATNRPWLLAALAEGSDFRRNEHDLTTAGTIQLEARPPDDADLAPLAAHIVAERAAAQPGSAWSLAGPYRAVTPATLTFHGDEGSGWQRTIQFSGEARPDERTIVGVGAGWELVSARGRWLVKPGPAPSTSSGSATLDGQVRAPMPGKVLDIVVEPGQEVAADEVVAVLEAMKIEISLTAPFAGTVGAISADPGDLVGLRQVIVTIEPHAE